MPPMVIQPLGSVTVDPIKPYGSSIEVSKNKIHSLENYISYSIFSQLEVPSSTSNSHMQGVYRQRSYDNLQNGKSPFHRSSVKSLHLPPTYANQQGGMQQLNRKFSLSTQKFAPVSVHRGYSPTPAHQQAHAIPSNFTYVSPQSQCQPDVDFDSNSLPRYPYHKNRAIQGRSQSQRFEGVPCEYYRYGNIRHPTTPPPPPPNKHGASDRADEQVLLPTPTSSTSSGDGCSGSEWDPMIASGSTVKRSGLDHMTHYRTCKRQIQQATSMLHPNPQHQMYIDNYLHQFGQQSPYRKYLNAVQNHQLQLSPQNVHVYHNPGKRHSNVYEYHFSNFDLNSIHERNES